MEPTNSPDFQHGYTSGVEGVNRETYEGYLSSQINTDLAYGADWGEAHGNSYS